MKSILFLGLAVLAGVAAFPAPVCSAVTLVQDGQPTAIIVRGSTESAKCASEEFRDTVKSMSGAELPILTDNAFDAAPSDQSVVCIGDSRAAARFGLDSQKLRAEAFLARVAGKNLVMLGRDSSASHPYLYGTFFAVATVEQDVLGCRWLWPGESGTVIPRSKTISIPDDLNIQQQPRLVQRSWRNSLDNGAFMAEIATKAGFNPKAYSKMCLDEELWARRQKMGESVALASGHNETFYSDVHATHPEWVAMQPNGSREWDSRDGNSDGAKMCVSNTALADYIANRALTAIRKKRPVDAQTPRGAPNHPWDAVSIGENDGAYHWFCLCDECKKLDPPDAPPIKLSYGSGAIEYRSLSDRYLEFDNRVAARVAKEYPDVLVVAFAYGATNLPPVRVKAHPNVVIQYVGPDGPYENDEACERLLKEVNGWRRAQAKLSWRSNWLRGGLDMITLYPHKYADDFKRFAAAGLLGVDFDTMMNDWGSFGLNYYVMVKLMWDPNLDVDALIDDYCKSGFGPAAAPIRAFFDFAEKQTSKRARQARSHETMLPAWIGAWSGDSVKQAEDRLNEARQLAAGDAAIAARIDFLGEALEFTKLRVSLMAAVADRAAGKPISDQQIAGLQEKLVSFIRARDTMAINRPYALYDQARFPDFFGPVRHP